MYAENGAPECTYTYDAWGKLLSVKNPAGTEMTSATYIGNLQSLKYRGYVYDRETGLYYLQSRYYDPVTRRFINADGIDIVIASTFASSKNLFCYCDDNPIIRADNGGFFWNTLFGAITGAIVGGISAAISGTDFWAGVASGAVAGGVAGAALDLVIVTGGTGLAAVAAVSLASGIGSATGSYINQRMNGVSHEDIDWCDVSIDGAWGVVSGALSYGIADVGGPKCKTPKQIVSQSSIKIINQAVDDFSTNCAVAGGTSLLSTASKHMVKGPSIPKGINSRIQSNTPIGGFSNIRCTNLIAIK